MSSVGPIGARHVPPVSHGDTIRVLLLQVGRLWRPRRHRGEAAPSRTGLRHGCRAARGGTL